MTVTVQFFSFLRDVVGRIETPLEIPEGSTVGELLAVLYRQYPKLSEWEKTILLAIGMEFAQRGDLLKEGDVVSLMPPLQGGMDSDELLLTDNAIEEREATVGTVPPETGAVIAFWGVVRELENGAPLQALDYSAYREMAEHQFRKLMDETKQRWPIRRVRVVHRLGTVPVGEASLLVRVEAGHRGEAFAAAQFLIDELKQKVPIWKRAVRA